MLCLSAVSDRSSNIDLKQYMYYKCFKKMLGQNVDGVTLGAFAVVV